MNECWAPISHKPVIAQNNRKEKIFFLLNNSFRGFITATNNLLQRSNVDKNKQKKLK